MLKLEQVSMSYGKQLVLDNINMELEPGIYGFLGANGVGKTTLFHIISMNISGYDGTVKYPKVEQKQDVLIGFLPQNFCGYPDMTVQEFLFYLGSVKSKYKKKEIKNDIKEKLELFHLSELKNKKLKHLSGGQLRRVGLAQAFQLNPKIVLLDEPTTGLDPTERIKFKNYMNGVGHNQIVLISTHIVSDLEYISKEIYILKDGGFVMSGKEEDLIEKCSGFVWEVEFNNELDLNQFAENHTISMIYDKGNKIQARVIHPTRPVEYAKEVAPTLNDVYLVNFKREGGDYEK